MTTGSPVASAVSGPGTDETKAMRLPSGDQATVRPLPGSGAFVPDISAMNRAPVPSGRATTSPVLSPTRPRYAIDWLSGDQTGLPVGSSSAPKRTLLPPASVITQSCPYGRPAPSLLSTTYATRAASGETCTADTDRSLRRSPLCSAPCAAASAATRNSAHATNRVVGFIV